MARLSHTDDLHPLTVCPADVRPALAEGPADEMHGAVVARCADRAFPRPLPDEPLT